MANQKPPRVVADEAGTLHALLQYQRESLVRKVADLDEASARRALVGSGTTLLWLIRHMADGEVTWVVRRFAGEEVVIDDPSPGGALADAVGFYRQTWRRVDAIAFTGRFRLDELCLWLDVDPSPKPSLGADAPARRDRPPRSDADILRELIDGRTGR